MGRLTDRINTANALGITNLAEKGVEVPESATTYEIMQSIASVSSGIEPIDHTVTFIADGEPYEIVSVKNGNSVNAPATVPTSESGNFTGWQLNGVTEDFPCEPKTDMEFVALFTSLSGLLYSHFGIDKSEYPLIAMNYINSSGYNFLLNIYFAKTFSQEDGYILTTGDQLRVRVQPAENFPYDNSASAVDWIVKNVSATPTSYTSSGWIGYDDNTYAYTNFVCNITKNPHYLL